MERTYICYTHSQELISYNFVRPYTTYMPLVFISYNFLE
jgi:hypothetical protein